MSLTIVPISLRVASAFIAEHHRHHKPPRGYKFAVGTVLDPLAWRDKHGQLVGQRSPRRPVARALDDGFTLEVNRTCTNGHRNANSMLYGATARAAKAMGYLRCLTYIQDGETGASLKAAGWVKVKDLPARGSWAASSVKLKDIRDPVGSGGVARQLWEIRFGSLDDQRLLLGKPEIVLTEAEMDELATAGER